MGIVRNFDRHKYNLPVYGDGIADTIQSVAEFVTQNKEAFKDVGQAVSSVSGAVGNISKAVQAAREFNELQAIKQKNATKLPHKVMDELKAVASSKKGDGFEKF